MKIAKQGWKTISWGAGLAFAGGALSTIRPCEGWTLAAIGLSFAAFCAYFFRDPERVCPAEDKKIYSPGDGTVLSVAREGPGDITTIRIFLSIFNVHVQRLPCTGVVEKVFYQKGSFAMAMKSHANVNERSVVTIDPRNGREKLIVEQIAGFVARRIETWIKPGERAKVGERYGIIYFGSQVAVHLARDARPKVLPGDPVAGGLTVIGEWIG